MASLTFLGGVGTVTGSKYLVEHEGVRVLVDCGLFQGSKPWREKNWDQPPFDPRSLDAVVITHAHVDHTGYLPRVVALGYSKSVYCSRGTADLVKILLPDSARLQEEEADYRNRKGLTRHQPALPLYTEEDARAALKLLRPLENRVDNVEIAKGVRLSLRVAGHILGSNLVVLELEGAGADGKGRRILFSGDLGHYDQPIIKDPDPPPACDYLLVESTYGDRLHDPIDPKADLARVINEGVERGGPILFPAFAIGRTQELVYYISELEEEKKIPILPVRVDSPMAAAATQAYGQRQEEHDAEYASVLAGKRHPLRTRSMLTASSREESKRLNDEQGTRIIISSSGMMTGGRVMHHARHILPDPSATVVFVGYQAEGTTGRQILEGARTVRIMKGDVPVRCHVERIEGLSAHADWQEVLRWLAPVQTPPRCAFTTHGEPESAEAMRQHIIERYGWRVEVPKYGETFELE
jgi:metallo-beta-lactamase family protein